MLKKILVLLAVLIIPQVSWAQTEVDNLKSTEANDVNCLVDRQDSPEYNGIFVSAHYPHQVQPGELFRIIYRIKNIGNTPWFSIESKCENQPPVFLGTTRQQDRLSIFHAPAIFGDTNWLQGNRIKMSTLRVDPGDIAEFSFLAHAPQEPSIYREYFSPVIENVTWINGDSESYIDITVGHPEYDERLINITREIPLSINLLDPQFDGDKKIVVDISDQRMKLQLGDYVIKEVPVSTGTWRTPTPFGTTSISLKQEVRVAAAWPHYIMPKFMMFRAGGYGIHALPSLANDRGIFWREALNHIGTRRSHGCIRLLPDDANFAFDFADVGTTVQVVP